VIAFAVGEVASVDWSKVTYWILFAVQFFGQVLVLSFELLDNLLAEVGSLGQLLFDFFVDGDVTVKSVDLRLHFGIFCQKLLRLLTLVLQLNSQLSILKYRQLSRSLQLVIVQSKQRCLGVLDLLEHLPAKFLSCLQLLAILFSV